MCKMGDCPIDEANLSFSGDHYDRDGGLFITQSAFHNVDNQVVNNAVDFFLW